ncbi:MAG: Isomerizing Glutamine-fructose-6-phosphate aminotransferase [Candidatus Uhrbacteria bacterium GW2011_GWA2_52_8d]|uniref:Glutamine--fructose-6-phosphate aminotransferase [isomerizing] n=1 Tax=Candidatus Uhrbacteria bacterium GW2011_GWA2_52_8d TaxID=1618979 RepID=A0A0G1XPH3_9BACT|nr:MAG: Isomerizing Glutamine-fructose-6-phosphate aminotransferase [Candidatus Uhrbacteria bacterium GW2011_GWA2_52_8d]
MCGIVGYVGSKSATPILMEGLKQLEYRGYDSAGICVQNGKLTTVRAEGKIARLEEKVAKFETRGTCGIAHTRWATHGVPEERNAHPHRDCTGRVAIVHNGIIENYQELKRELIARRSERSIMSDRTLLIRARRSKQGFKSLIDDGHSFASDTDSEVLAHMIEQELSGGTALFAAVKKVLARIRGTYGLVVLTKDVPQTLIAARMGSPLVVGIGEGEYFVASDPSAIIAHTKDVLYLDDGEIVAVTSEGVSLDGVVGARVQDRVSKIDWDVEEATKAGHPHFMLKEILEQPEVIENSTRGRMDLLNGRCVLGGLEAVRNRLSEIDRIVIVGCGSAYYAGLVGEYLLEELAGIPVEVELASEFRYRKPLLTTRTAVLAISQSGETADTLEAVREAKRKNVLALGLVNVVGSSIARETDAGVYNHAGPEVGVASTKAREILDRREEMTSIASTLKGAEHCLFLGRTFHAPIAYEGALKLKEVSYIHAEGYTSGEMKHGPIALINEGFPCVVLCPQDEMFEKNWSNIQELRARGAHVIAITTQCPGGPLMVQSQFTVPQTHNVLQPILSTIPLQLLAYEVAVARNLDPDKPRNLAKSVTVE